MVNRIIGIAPLRYLLKGDVWVPYTPYVVDAVMLIDNMSKSIEHGKPLGSTACFVHRPMLIQVICALPKFELICGPAGRVETEVLTW